MLNVPRKPFWVSFLNAISYLFMAGMVSTLARGVHAYKGDSGLELLFVVVFFVALFVGMVMFRGWQDKVWPSPEKFSANVKAVYERNPKLVNLAMADVPTFLNCFFLNYKATDRYKTFDTKKFSVYLYNEWNAAGGSIGLDEFSSFTRAAAALRWACNKFPDNGSRYHLCLSARSDLAGYISRNEEDVLRLLSKAEVAKIKELLAIDHDVD